LGNLKGVSSIGEMDEGGSRNGASLSEETQCGGLLGRVPLLGTPKDMLGFLFLEPGDIKNISRRPSGILVR
jgi:hypothetical protein